MHSEQKDFSEKGLETELKTRTSFVVTEEFFRPEPTTRFCDTIYDLRPNLPTN